MHKHSGQILRVNSLISASVGSGPASVTSNGLTLLFILIFLFFMVSCQSSPKKLPELRHLSIHDEGYIANLKEKLKSDLKLDKGTQLAYFLYDPETQSVLESQNEDVALVPASTTKVITALTVLKTLGPEYKFKTTLAYTGTIKNKTLHGDLYLKGGGDPLLTVPHIMNFARILADHNITKITGNFYIDDTAILSREMIKNPEVPGDSSASYNPGISALSVDFNQLYLRWSRNPDSKNKLDVVAVPDLPIFEIALADSEQANAFQYQPQPHLLAPSAPNSTPVLPATSPHLPKEKWLLSSPLSPTGEKRLPLKNPSLAFALLFSQFSKMNGITLPFPKFRALRTQKSTLLATHESISLVDIVEKGLEFSNNMMSELMLLAAARKLHHAPVDIPQAADTLTHWIRRSIPALPLSQKKFSWDGFTLKTGSGITSENRVTAKQLVSVLNYADKSHYSDRTFESLLPVSGWKGTLVEHLRYPETAMHVWAKTGTIMYGSALTGFVHTNQGRRLIFAIMISDLEKREMIDRYGESIPSGAATKAKTWIRRAEEAHEDLLQRWILSY